MKLSIEKEKKKYNIAINTSLSNMNGHVAVMPYSQSFHFVTLGSRVPISSSSS